MTDRLTVSEFARQAGCDEKQVRRAIAAGKLTKGSDDRLDAASLDAPWRRPNRRTILKKAPAPRARKAVSDETPAQAAERIVRETGLLPFDEALQLKENYLARRQQLEYDLKAGTVVVAADVARAVGAEYAGVRTKLLAIPSERAAEIHRQKTVREVDALLRSIVVEALGGLTLDRAPAA